MNTNRPADAVLTKELLSGVPVFRFSMDFRIQRAVLLHRRAASIGLLIIFLLCLKPAAMAADDCGLGFPPSNAKRIQAPVRRALLIGINVYLPGSAPKLPNSRFDTQPGPTWVNLDGAVNDAKAMATLLIAKYGFDPQNVHCLLDQAATREAILAAIQRDFIAEASPGDHAFFYYAGHGSMQRNSASHKPDGYDESIVPADSYRGAPDILDQDLKKVFHQVLTAGVHLAAVFDSCHSGSITRGFSKIRQLPPNENDIHRKPYDDILPPEEEGAVIISAALHTQAAAESIAADGTHHGAFTEALLETLREAPSGEDAEDVFEQTRARLEINGLQQEPMLQANAQRRSAPLFDDAVASEGKTMFVMRRRSGEDQIELNGGSALGAGPGTKLVSIDGPTPPVQIEIIEQSLTESVARVLSGDIAKVSSGQLFSIQVWTPPDAGRLSLWVAGAADLPSAIVSLEAVAAALRKAGVAVEDNPVFTPTTYLLAWSRNHPSLIDIVDGSTLEINTDADLLAATKKLLSEHRPVTVSLPAPEKLSMDLAKAKWFAFAGNPTCSSYLLFGTRVGDSLRYAWVKPTQGQPHNRPASASTMDVVQPVKWVGASNNPQSLDVASASLLHEIQWLSRINAWLHLAPPPDAEANFPYHLTVTNTESGQELPVSSILVDDGKTNFGLTLKADTRHPRVPPGCCYVTVFAIDQEGNGTTIFPIEADGSDQTQFPPRSQYPEDAAPLEIRLQSANGNKEFFQASPPYGAEVFFLLATSEPLNPALFRLKRGVGESAQSRGDTDPLREFFSALHGAGERGGPMSWSLSRLVMYTARN